jgi:hypothetical protein
MNVTGVHVTKLIETDTVCFLAQLILKIQVFQTLLRQHAHVILVKCFL